MFETDAHDRLVRRCKRVVLCSTGLLVVGGVSASLHPTQPTLSFATFLAIWFGFCGAFGGAVLGCFVARARHHLRLANRTLSHLNHEQGE